MGLAVVSLLVVAIFGALAGLVASRVLTTAVARNDDRPGDGAVGLSDEKRPSNEEIVDEAEAIKRTGPFLGGAVALMGVPMAIVGAFVSTGVVGDASFTDTVPSTTLAAFLGLLGYVLGARRVGSAVLIFAMIALMFGLLASQGYIPGISPTDHGLPAAEPGAPAGAVS